MTVLDITGILLAMTPLIISLIVMARQVRSSNNKKRRGDSDQHDARTARELDRLARVYDRVVDIQAERIGYLQGQVVQTRKELEHCREVLAQRGYRR